MQINTIYLASSQSCSGIKQSVDH